MAGGQQKKQAKLASAQSDQSFRWTLYNGYDGYSTGSHANLCLSLDTDSKVT